MNNIILIDTSYTSFYRFFATLKWMASAHHDIYTMYKNDTTYDWMENKIFIDMYEKMYLMAITKLLKKKIMQNSIIVFCMDAPRESLWRMQIDSNYKATRIDMNLKYNIKPIFKHTYKTIIPNIIKENKNMFSILIPNCEADDIIACITLSLKNKPNQNIIIVSGDNDFLQLGRVNVKFVNYRQKTLFEIDEIKAVLYLHEKILLY